MSDSNPCFRSCSGAGSTDPAYAIAEKQLYTSRYSESALDLTVCIRNQDTPERPGFYLIGSVPVRALQGASRANVPIISPASALSTMTPKCHTRM
jgi:hypothetical protein